MHEHVDAAVSGRPEMPAVGNARQGGRSILPELGGQIFNHANDNISHTAPYTGKAVLALFSSQEIEIIISHELRDGDQIDREQEVLGAAVQHHGERV